MKIADYKRAAEELRAFNWWAAGRRRYAIPLWMDGYHTSWVMIARGLRRNADGVVHLVEVTKEQNDRAVREWLKTLATALTRKN